MSGGGLLQLVAYGSQDVYLTGNATVTFFKSVSRRHTAFAIESIQQTINGTVDWNQRVTATISRNGDLMYGAMLEITVPTIGATKDVSWVSGLAYAIVNVAELDIGGQRIDRITGQYLDMMQELAVKEEKQAGLNKMVGRDWTGRDVFGLPARIGGKKQPGKMYLPLDFFFAKSPNLALPIIALQYHEIKLTFTFAEVASCLRSWVGASSTETEGWGKYGATPSDTFGSTYKLDVALYIDYVFLDSDERRKFAQVSHEMLVTQVQHTGVESLSVTGAGTTFKQRLNLNHPCKALIWTCAADPSADLGNTAISMPSRSLDAFDCSEYSGYDMATITIPANSTTHPRTGLAASTHAHITGHNHSLAANLDEYITRGAVAAPGNNPVIEAKLTLNGHDRFSEREGTYFQYVQPYMHWPRVPTKPIMTYSFAISPADQSPSGTANFSRIDTAHLNLKFAATHTKFTGTGAKTSVSRNFALYAINYNVLRILSGMGGLAFSN
jgi:hypothetical protein